MVMRPVAIVDKPPIHPHVCVVCGKQNEREYFVDTGIDIDHQYFQAVFEGSLFLCCICMESLINDYYAKLSKHIDHLPAASNMYTYLNAGQDELPFGEENDTTEAGNSTGEVTGSDSESSSSESDSERESTGIDGNSSSAELINSEPDTEQSTGNPLLFNGGIKDF